MIDLHPNILEKEGRKEFAILTYEEYLQVQEELENYEDLKKLRAAKIKEANAPTIPLAEVRKSMSI